MPVLEGIRCAYATLSVAGTVNISSAPTFLHTINFNDTTAGTLTVCNGTAVDAGTAALILCGSMGTQIFDIECGSGLKMVTSGNSKITIGYCKIANI